jgi:hypothetical protein
MSDPQAKPKPRKGCVFYGCLTLAILSVAVLVGGGLGLYLLYQKAEAFVEQYAGTEPMELPDVRYTDIDKEQFDKRLRIFADGLAEGRPTVPLVLKGEDLNMLLASSPELAVLSEGVRLNVEGDEIKGQVSLKLGDLGAPFFKERYLNGEISFKASLEDGRLTVSPSEILVNGEALPEKYLAAIREHNMAESANQNPDVMETLNRLETIEVRDGTVRVVPQDTD